MNEKIERLLVEAERAGLLADVEREARLRQKAVADVSPGEEPRPYTVEEMRHKFLSEVRMIAREWATNVEWKSGNDVGKEIERRCNGVAFSILAMIDGSHLGIPALDLVPSPLAEDKSYHQSNGENWWEPHVINDCQLHEKWHERKD